MKQNICGDAKVSKYRVSWRSKKAVGSSVYEGKSQCEVLMKVMKVLSEDGVHAPVCRIKVEPVKE